jgi:hypothetical protein
LKKIITILIVTFFTPLILLIVLLVSGGASSDQVGVDERFKLSSAIESPYPNVLQGSYKYSFAFCGDPHMQSKGEGFFPELDITIRQKMANFVIFGGDLTFLGQEAEYKNFLKNANDLTVPSYPALGNHDLYNSGWSNYWKYLGPSAYSFYGGNAKFIVIDSAGGRIGEEQMEWIKRQLKTNTQPLLFVVSHLPVCGGSYALYNFPEFEDRDELIKLFEKYGVDYVLQSHYHGYADTTVNGVRYITSGSFSDGLLDSGQRHFLLLNVYGPYVNIDKIIVGPDELVELRDSKI